MTRAEFAAAAASVAFVPATPRARLATRAERTDYAQPSGISDVACVLEELDRRGAPIARGSIGTTSEGRAIPYVVASRPIVRSPEEARALARPIVLVRAAADAGKVEGTDAMLAMLRDLCVSTQKTLLEEIVLIVLPLFNVDGSERSLPVAINAPMQNGPPFVGTRTNAAGIDLDADFVVAAAPETRALLAFVDAWRPDAFVDLSSDGASFDTFGATFAPALHPAAAVAGAFVRDEMMHAVRAEMRAAFEIETSTCGRFGRVAPLPEPPPPGDAGYGWFAGDHRPRTCVNAMGVRGIPAMRVAAYAHDAFERRIFTTRASVETILGFCSDRAARVRAVAAAGARWNGGAVPIRAALAGTPARYETIAWENLTLDGGAVHEPGIPAGFRRTGTFERARLPVYDRYVATAFAHESDGYAIDARFADVVGPLLRAHGIAFVRGAGPAGHLVVPTDQPLGALAAVLLEPESDDGFSAWNVYA